MFAKITASTLMLLMVFITMAKHQSVNYCTIKKEFSLFECHVEVVAEGENHCECCGSCADTNQSDDHSDKKSVSNIFPSSCCIVLWLEDSYDSLEQEQLRFSEVKVQEVDVVWSDSTLTKLGSTRSCTGARAPPNIPDTYQVPVYIRHSIFLI